MSELLLTAQAYEEGVYAAKTGKPETTCPYDKALLLAAWLRGWNSYRRKPVDNDPA